MKKGYSALYGFIPISFLLSILLTSAAFAGAYTPPSSSATATVHVSEACSLTSSVITPHTDNMGNGTYTDSLGSTKFTVKCNDASGFALYAIGYSGDEYGATSMLGDNELSIPTGTDASAGNTTSHWSMKISKDTTSYLPNSLTIENSFGSQHLIPSTYTKIASFPSSTDGTNGTGSSILATYGVRISGTQAAGTYIGKVKYTLVHPNMNDNSNKPAEPLPASACPANSICYAPNADDIIGSMSSLGVVSGSDKAGKQTETMTLEGPAIISSNSTAQLISPNYSRPGYGFAGWSTDYEATSSSTIYGPNEEIAVGDVSTNGMILYPVWILSTGTLQGWSGCNSLTQATYDSTNHRMIATLSSVTALVDARDSNVYAVARLADGKCWMIENLRLDAENSSDDSLAQGFGGVFAGLADSENINFNSTDPTTANNATNSLYSSDGSTEINIGNGNYAGYHMPRYNNNNINRNLTISYSGTGNSTYYQWYSYGNYYTWAAAMANTTFLNSYTDSEGANTSICPTGWRLPYGNNSNTGNTAGGFYYLNTTMSNDASTQGSNDLRKFPNNFIHSGNFNDSSARNRSEIGYYWSNSARNYSNAYAFLLNRNSYSVNFTYNANKNNGFSIRCIFGS